MVILDVLAHEVIFLTHVGKLARDDRIHALELSYHVSAFRLKHLIFSDCSKLAPNAVAEDLHFVVYHVDLLEPLV